MFNPSIAILYGMNTCSIRNYSEVWREVSIHSGTMSDLISGRMQPSLALMNRLAKYFKVPLSTFILWGEQDLNIDQLKEDLKWR